MSYQTGTGAGIGQTSGTTGQRTVTAFFDDRTSAEAAVSRLVAAGIERSRIDLRAGGSTGSTTSTSTSATSGTRGSEPGFWESLKDLFMPEEDRATYAEGLRRGGHLVVVHTDQQHYERALDILDDEGTVDLDQRASSWKQEGWTGYAGLRGPATGSSSALDMLNPTGNTTNRTATTATTATQGTDTTVGTTAAPGYAAAGGVRGQTSGASTTTTATPGLGATGLGATGRTSETDTLRDGREEVIPVTEEELRIGKREVHHGRVRVRSYVVETPVNEEVRLREERVSVERRPVDRAVTGNEALFKDRVIEAEERAEEAVVSKEARVREELVLRKQAEERTQTVSDTVRRTEVEVEDERGTTGVGQSQTNRRA